MENFRGGEGRVKVVGIGVHQKLRKKHAFPGGSMQKNGKFQGVNFKKIDIFNRGKIIFWKAQLGEYYNHTPYAYTHNSRYFRKCSKNPYTGF